MGLFFTIKGELLVSCSSPFMMGGWGFLAQWRNTGGLKQKHKKQPFGDTSASHLSLVLWHV